ncbi:DUF2491 family protein [Stappia sp. BW2]|jgi:hypothetical protein|uniref:DUF2491 family protein n=1 Tax=Stappia sp. BW2 TaxID=2592622 RepID=UPI0011DE918B|nr:DUF2491 family protein [Stappia sp. BW2]TYC80042.1 DUF2491 family protein [Stappia sp. BW2]
MFGSLFNRKAKGWQPPEILGLTIGRGISFDPIALRLLPTDSLIERPDTTLMITAQGHCDLGEQSHMHRFYPDDDRFLIQFQGGDGAEDERVDEIMLWYFYDVQYPSGDAEWNRVKTAIRQTSFSLPGDGQDYRFERAWFDTSTVPEDPMTYWEEVCDDREGGGRRKIFQTAMLFARTLQDGRDEMLLVNMEEPENAERSVAFMLGFPLERHNFSV